MVYTFTPTNPWTGPTPTPPPGPIGWGGGSGWGGNPAPNGRCAFAYLGDGASTYEIFLDVPVTLGTLVFDSNTSYTISGPCTLTMDCDHAYINVSRGSHTISAPIHYAANTTVTIAQSPDTLTTSGTMTFAAGVTIDKQGPGAWVAKHVRTGTLSVQNGKVKMIADQTADGTSVINALAVNDALGATLDLNQTT